MLKGPCTQVTQAETCRSWRRITVPTCHIQAIGGMLALLPNPPPFQAQEPVPRKMDYPASEYSVLAPLGDGPGVPTATHCPG